MKKFLTLLTVGFLMMVQVKAQTKHTYRETSGFKISHGITIGGVGFTVAGFLTPPIYTSVNNPNSTSSYNTTQQKLPFNKQGPRAASIVTGITLTATGLITMMIGK